MTKQPHANARKICSTAQMNEMLKKRIAGLKKKVGVFIPELRMTVYVNPGQSEEDVRKKYLAQRGFEKKTVPNLLW